MGEMQTINNVALTVKEYYGARVVTFKEIDAVHGRPDGTASRNFRANRGHFIEGEDFFKITPDEFRRTIGEMDSRQQNEITLITESGYLMLVKSFTDDLAWEVQRELVNGYFRAKKSLTGAEQLLAQAQYLVEQERRLKAVEEKQNRFDGALAVMAAPMLESDGWQERAQKEINTTIEQFGLNHQMFRRDIYDEVERLAHVNLERRQTLLRNRMSRMGASSSECKAVSKLHVIARDPKLRPIFETVLRRKVVRLTQERGVR